MLDTSWSQMSGILQIFILTLFCDLKAWELNLVLTFSYNWPQVIKYYIFDNETQYIIVTCIEYF